MKTALKVILLLGVVAYLIYAIIGLSHTDKDYVCRGMEIAIKDSTSNTFIDREYIKDLLAEAQISPEGNSISSIDLHSIENVIEKNAYIDSVLCYFTAEHKLCVSVTPRNPILHVMTEEGADFYMDAKGNSMPANTFYLDLPLATGHISADFTRKHLLVLAEYLNNNPEWNEYVEQIVVKDANDIMLVPSTGDFLVDIGNTDDIDTKMQRLNTFIKEGLSQAGWNKYSIIDVSYDHQVVCTKNKQ